MEQWEESYDLAAFTQALNDYPTIDILHPRMGRMDDMGESLLGAKR